MLGLNLDLLQFCQKEVLQALTVLTNPSSYPILVHCTQGKDRSGITIMLVLFILLRLDTHEPDSEASIVKFNAIKHDYTLSGPGLSRIRDTMLPEVRSIGMDEDYLGAPPVVVDTVYRYLVEKYGGPEAYLDMVGFGPEKRETLRSILLV
ncbi:hypothetical protein PM082_001624 [Marasmius tenuissimus]|nr:hypothetical protein PM082_001624 [Marasmius tenuissimus]